MAMAVQKLYNDSKTTIGPWTENGFFYDFYFSNHISDSDLVAIKCEMDKIIKANHPIMREEVSREEARARIVKQDEPFKLEILEKISEPITIYHIGNEWWDLCAGPHVKSTGVLDSKAIELLSVAGAYWQGDERRQSLQRITGTAWLNSSQLKQHQQLLVEAKRRDHRTIGRDLDLFSIQSDAGGGLVFWHPKGACVRAAIEDYWRREHVQAGYEILYTPHMANLDLWKTSGHCDFYKDDMFQPLRVGI